MEKDAIKRARALRQAMTRGEKDLWQDLRQLRKSHGVHVRRQAPVGPYIADFISHAHRLVIEVDGETHQAEIQKHRDAIRDAWFVDNGYRTLRISTGDLKKNKAGCVETILNALEVKPE